MEKVTESILHYFEKKGYKISYFTEEHEKKPAGTLTVHFINVENKNTIFRNQSRISYDDALRAAYDSIKSEELKAIA